jgi:hypothetical protein
MRIEAISKHQMAFEGKAKVDEKAQHTREYVSILKRLSTQPSSVRWGFEMAYREKLRPCMGERKSGVRVHSLLKTGFCVAEKIFLPVTPDFHSENNHA